MGFRKTAACVAGGSRLNSNRQVAEWGLGRLRPVWLAGPDLTVTDKPQSVVSNVCWRNSACVDDGFRINSNRQAHAKRLRDAMKWVTRTIRCNKCPRGTRPWRRSGGWRPGVEPGKASATRPYASHTECQGHLSMAISVSRLTCCAGWVLYIWV